LDIGLGATIICCITLRRRNYMHEKLTHPFITERIVSLPRLILFTLALVSALLVTQIGSFEVNGSTLATSSKDATRSVRENAQHSKPAKSSGKDDKRTKGESQFTTFDGARIHYVNYNRDSGARGKGKAKAGNDEEALVLIHGWTMNIDNWRDQIPAFTNRSRVLAIDLVGHGQSDKPQAVYTMDYFARAVEAVMRHAKVKRAVLVGHSMGTPIARQFYRKYPEKTLAIVIVDGALRPFGDKAMMDKMIAGLRVPTYNDTIGQMFGMMMGPGLPAEAQERIKASTLKTPQYVLVSAMEGMADTTIYADDKINVPVLAIMAKNPFFPPNLEEVYRTLIPNLEFYMWDGVGHFLMMEKPKEFNEAVLAFLDKNKLLN
jgi:pimeloyl-ACP methyl ester carboxylesterase